MAFSKHTFALRNCGQLLSGAGGLSVSFYIVCSGGAKISGGGQTLKMAVGSRRHPIHLLLSLTSPETGYPPPTTPISHAWVQALEEPGGLSQSQVLLDLQSCHWCPPAFPSSCLLQGGMLRTHLLFHTNV